MRAGQIGADDVARLKDRGLLNYAKEVAGLERGNKALTERLGVPVQRLRDVLKDDVIGGLKSKDSLRAAAGATDALMTPQFGGAATFMRPQGPSRIVHSTTIDPLSKGLKGEARRGARAVTLRHELDELALAKRLASKGAQEPKFIVTKTPKSMAEKLTAKQLDVQRAIQSRAAAAEYPALRNAAAGMDLGSQMSVGMPLSKIPQGKVVSGRHMSPEVITRESSNVAMMPPEVGKAFSKWRGGEQEMLGRHGFEYGKSLPKRTVKRIAKEYGA